MKVRIWKWCGLVAFMAVGLCAAAREGKFQDTFNVDKAALADKGSGTYMIREPGHKLILKDGEDTLTITVLNETKKVDGVTTRIVEERETKNGKLEEVSRNYFAIDKVTGNIYYFGEDVDMYDAKGNVKGHEGSWLSGADGARFGLMMPGKPEIGQCYQQEVAPKTAMDRAEVISITEEVTVPAGTFKNCLKTKESSGFENGSEEKLYAPGVGLLKDGGFKLAKIETAKRELPEPVAKTFKATFPKAEIEKIDVEKENGVTVYDLEFREGAVEKETDIAADGTMLEFTIVVGEKDVPEAAMDTIRKAAEGAVIKRIEHIEISYETKDGKVTKLDKPVTNYAAEIEKAGKTSETVVYPDGKKVEKSEGKEEEEKNENEQKVSIDQVPAAVKAAIMSEAGKGTVEEIEQESKDGKTIYGADIIVDGKKYEIKVSPDGKIIDKHEENDND